MPDLLKRNTRRKRWRFARLSPWAGCEAKPSSDPAFKDVQRVPPITKRATVEYLVGNDRLLAEWVAETSRKCDKFGCVGQDN